VGDLISLFLLAMLPDFVVAGDKNCHWHRPLRFSRVPSQVRNSCRHNPLPSPPVLCQMPFLSQRSQFTWVWDWCRVLLYTHPVTYWNPCGLSVLSVNFCCCRVECCPVIYDSVNKTSSPLN